MFLHWQVRHFVGGGLLSLARNKENNLNALFCVDNNDIYSLLERDKTNVSAHLYVDNEIYNLLERENKKCKCPFLC